MRDYFVWLAKLLTILVLVFFVVPLMLVAVGALSKSEQALAGSGKNKVAVVELTGMILDSKDILSSLQKQINDKSVDGIVLRIDSPGGAVGPSQDIYQAVRTLKSQKPIVASMGSVAASGGLYSALGASKIYAQSGTLTGSIGVIVQFPNLTKIADKLGFEMMTIKSGKLKDIGNSFRNMTEEDLNYLQSTVDAIQGEFVKAVVEGRGLDKNTVMQFADGRVLTGLKAKELKVIDEFGGLMEASRAVYDLLGKPLAADVQPELYYPEDNFDKLKKLLNAAVDFPARVLGFPANSAKFELLYMM